jgi:hypothetical protein
VTYQQPAIDERVKVAGPLINGPSAPTSPAVPTPTWAPHDDADAS